jgi:hypothetical protein
VRSRLPGDDTAARIPEHGRVPVRQQEGCSVAGAETFEARQPADTPPGPQAKPAALNLLLKELGVTFDRWVVLNAVATGLVPAEVGRLVPALAAAVCTTERAARWMLDEAEAAHHVRVVSAPDGDPADARVELTAEGEVLHDRLLGVVGFGW